ncbi:LysR family transcriptional regulator [Bradyrhizobium lablabi]|uniref:LysR substrate-binding domain-containing protein n=1 Tax=Bradyrhizobium lablabi TaxID=722472 RepID=UPI001BAB82AB|nr:LysR substrate-binding domain-containing protein [Bradyrhizobium lablabi]MBR1123338.1 LysR family transcriptional regulator [Bradyrhizobium lablabi]
MISLKQLRYFDSVARLKHFGRAAEQCAVTQPALSMQIQELERELGVQLIERSRSGVLLTEAGREIARRASRVLSETRDIVDFARRQGNLLSGPLHLGVIPSIAPYVLPALLPLVRDKFPDLDLHLRETQTDTLVDELLDGALDLLLLALPVEDPEIETLKLFNDRFLLAMPKSRRITNRIRATPDLLEQDRLLLLEEGHCLRDQALSFCNLRRVDNIDTFGASNLSTIVQMVANGLGMTLLPELSIKLECRHDDIRLMRFTDPQPRRVVGLAWRKSSPRKSHFAELGKLITEATSGQMLASEAV